MLGRKVRHPDFGVGTVVGVEGIGDDRRISVSFPGRGATSNLNEAPHSPFYADHGQWPVFKTDPSGRGLTMGTRQ